MIRNTLAGIGLLISVLCMYIACSAIPAIAPSEPEMATVTILHTNDTHAHLEDIARRAAIIKDIRNQSGKENVLLLDSGDVFMGTIYYNLMHGAADIAFMNMLNYDAMALGNHEFDGYDQRPNYLTEFVRNAEFPVISANIRTNRDANLNGKIKPWIVIERAGTKFGVFGLLIEDTAVISNPGKTIIIEDHIKWAEKAVAEFKSKGIYKIIALTHIGWHEDLALAKKVKGIDIIIGGHSHTIPSKYPTFVNSAEPTLVVQAGSNGRYLGRIDVTFDRSGFIREYNGALYEVKNADEDPAYTAKLAEYSAPLAQMKETVIGESTVVLNGEREDIRTSETNLGNLVADAFLDKAHMAKATIAIINAGNIRTSIPPGKISFGKIIEVLPFNNDIVVFNLRGNDIRAALENGVSLIENEAGRFPQVSGLKFEWDPKRPAGTRIISVDIKTGDEYRELDNKATYRLVTNSYLLGGGDGYSMFKNGTDIEYLGFTDYEIVKDYISSKSPVTIHTENRITSR